MCPTSYHSGATKGLLLSGKRHGAVAFLPILPQVMQDRKTNEQLVVAFVTGVLLNIGPGVTRLSPYCYTEPLEYSCHGKKAGK